MINYITIADYNITTLFLAWLWVYFTPLQNLIDKLYKRLPDNWIQTTRTYLGCFKCVTFWSTLFVTQDVVLAAALAMIAMAYNNYIKQTRFLI